MRAVIKLFFLQGKAPKEIHTILTETLARFLPGRAEDLSAPLYNIFVSWACEIVAKILKSHSGIETHGRTDGQPDLRLVHAFPAK